MRQGKSFIQVLEERIRHDLLQELQQLQQLQQLQEQQESQELQEQWQAQSDYAPERRMSESFGEEANRARVQPAAMAGEISETWLAAHVTKSFFAPTTAAARSYRSAQAATAARAGRPAGPGATGPYANAANPPSVNRSESVSAHAVTAGEIFAVELLERASATRLGIDFTESQLRVAWKKAALRTHPDRHATADPATQAKMGEAFSALAEAYETLARLFD